MLPNNFRLQNLQTMENVSLSVGGVDQIAWLAAGRIAEITPPQPLQDSTPYMMYLSPGISKLSGETFGIHYQSQFTTVTVPPAVSSA